MNLAASTDLLYGVHPVLEALRAKDVGLHRIYLQEGRRGRVVEEILRLAKARHVPVAFEAREALDRRAGSGRHQGAVGIASAKAYLSLDELLEAVRRHALPLLLVLDGIEDPRNLGAIVPARRPRRQCRADYRAAQGGELLGLRARRKRDSQLLGSGLSRPGGVSGGW